jgi:hypothetical protein
MNDPGDMANTFKKGKHRNQINQFIGGEEKLYEGDVWNQAFLGLSVK